MCGKTQVAIVRDHLTGFVEIQNLRLGTSMEGWAPPAETAPTNLSPVIVRGPSGEVVMELQRWGLPPPPIPGARKPVINARADKLRTQDVLSRMQRSWDVPVRAELLPLRHRDVRLL